LFIFVEFKLNIFLTYRTEMRMSGHWRRESGNPILSFCVSTELPPVYAGHLKVCTSHQTTEI